MGIHVVFSQNTLDGYRRTTLAASRLCVGNKLQNPNETWLAKKPSTEPVEAKAP